MNYSSKFNVQFTACISCQFEMFKFVHCCVYEKRGAVFYIDIDITTTTTTERAALQFVNRCYNP